MTNGADDVTEASNGNPPLGIASTEGLGLAPERAIDVLYIALPDGTGLWSDTVTAEYAKQCMASWRAGLTDAKRAEYEAAGVMGGVVVLRMLRSDYQHIPTTNVIAWPNSN